MFFDKKIENLKIDQILGFLRGTRFEYKSNTRQ